MHTRLLATPVSRRRFVLGSAAASVALATFGPRSILAAQSQPSYDALSYPTLDLTVSDTGYDGMPASTAAGRYLLKLTGKNTQGPAAAGFVSPPAGMTPKDALSQITMFAGGPPANASPAAGGTPPAGMSMGATPSAEGNEGGPEIEILPDWVYQSRMAGGPYVNPGTSTEAVIDLLPGDWFLWGDDPTAPQKPVIFTVTGDFPTDVKDPTSDVTATLVDFAITMGGTLTAGDHSIAIKNIGAEPHFLIVSRIPDGMTKDQLLQALMSPSGPPPDLQQAANEPNFQSTAQSIGVTTWQLIPLSKAGTYAALCFFPTAGTGVPHAMNGMIEVFQVTG